MLSMDPPVAKPYEATAPDSSASTSAEPKSEPHEVQSPGEKDQSSSSTEVKPDEPAAKLETEAQPEPTYSKKGWETPPQEPVNGVVQPRTVPPPGKPTRQTNQLEFLAREVLKPALKHKHAWPFLKPVDAIKLNIPDYHKMIKRPMDLGTIEKRLKNHYYTCAEECTNDIFRVFNNCYQFNQNEDDVSLMCKNIENVIRDKLALMPTEEVELPKSVPKKAGKVAKKTAQRGASISSATGRVSRESSATRDSEEKKAIKRKAESPLPVKEDKTPRRSEPLHSRYETLKNMDYHAFKPRYTGKLSSQMKFCGRLIMELIQSKKCKDFSWPFLEPVNDIELNIPDYYQVIKKPMDLGSIKKKFDARQYATAQEFKDDVHSVMNNCFLYNPEGQMVNAMGKQMLKYFDARWKDLPKEVEVVVEPPAPVTSRFDPYAFPGTPAVAPIMSTPASTVPLQFGPLNTDDDIDLLLNEVQNEHIRASQRLSELQQYIQELMQLKLKRREAREQRAIAPPLSGELHSHIKRSLMAAGTAPPTPFTSTLGQPTYGMVATPSTITPSPAPVVLSPVGSAAASAALSAAAVVSNGVKRRAGRPKGSTNVPKVPAATLPILAANPLPNPPSAPMHAQPGGLLNFAAPTAVDASMPPPIQPVQQKSGRGRKPGVKNKPKNVPKEERAEYEFNSDEEQAAEPMTYDEKRRLSTNINHLPSDRLSKVLSIISKREDFRDEVNPEEVEIDFEILKPTTLRELEAFVNSCNRNTARRPNAPRAQESAVRKKEIEERLAQINGSQQPRRGPGAPPAPRGRPPASTKATERDNSSESSSSSGSSSSSESSSSDSSDSEPETKEPSRQGQNGVPPVNRPTAPSKPTAQNNNTISQAPHINGVKSDEAKRNIVHSGAGPLLQSNNAAQHAGISGSVLDQLLPAAEASADAGAGLSKGNIQNSFDSFRRMKKEKDTTRQSLVQRDQERQRNPQENAAPSMDEIHRLKMQEKERRQRELATDDGITTQMDIMANFEDNF